MSVLCILFIFIFRIVFFVFVCLFCFVILCLVDFFVFGRRFCFFVFSLLKNENIGEKIVFNSFCDFECVIFIFGDFRMFIFNDVGLLLLLLLKCVFKFVGVIGFVVASSEFVRLVVDFLIEFVMNDVLFVGGWNMDFGGVCVFFDGFVFVFVFFEDFIRFALFLVDFLSRSRFVFRFFLFNDLNNFIVFFINLDDCCCLLFVVGDLKLWCGCCLCVFVSYFLFRVGCFVRAFVSFNCYCFCII